MEKLIKKEKKYLSEFERQKAEIRRLWNLDEKSQHLIYMLIRMKNPRRMLEIGTSNGFSAFWWSLALEEGSGVLDTIEVFEERYLMAKRNLVSRKNIRQYFGKAEDIIPDLSEKYDFVFIDAGKIGYISYIKLLENKLADNAVVVADNTISHAETVAEYLDFIRNSPHFTTMELPDDSGLEISIFKR